MPYSQRTKQLVANIMVRIKRNELSNGRLKFLVFTGTVGKTTIRDAVAFTLKKLGYAVESNHLGYSNEIGVLLTALGISKFSAKNPYDWFRVLRARINREKFVCIELGADFYHDIPWFLTHFVPFAVFVGGLAEKDWADRVKKTFRYRKRLLESVPKNGFVIYNADDKPTERLMKAAKIQGCKVNFSIKNKNSEILLKENRPLFEPQRYALLAAMGFASALNHNQISEAFFKDYGFTPQRLQFARAKNNAIILEYSYKATPLCTFWFLRTADKIQAQKKILFITEMRPLNLNIKYFYHQLANMVRFADSVYFLGPDTYWKQMANVNEKIEHIRVFDYPSIAEHVLKKTDEKSLILLKGSFRYHLEKLKKLLL